MGAACGVRVTNNRNSCQALSVCTFPLDVNSVCMCSLKTIWLYSSYTINQLQYMFSVKDNKTTIFQQRSDVVFVVPGLWLYPGFRCVLNLWLSGQQSPLCCQQWWRGSAEGKIFKGDRKHEYCWGWIWGGGLTFSWWCEGSKQQGSTRSMHIVLKISHLVTWSRMWGNTLKHR